MVRAFKARLLHRYRCVILRLAWCCDTCVALVRLHDPHPARATVRDLTSVCGQKQKYNYDPTGYIVHTLLT